jgi:3-ketoacyl-CoA synthase
MLVNRYKMRPGIKSFNISGMGCAASLLALDMAKHLLAVNPESYALVVSSENMSGRDYMGAKRSMLIANCLFRTGGAAVLLSNRRADARAAKYRLVHTERSNTAADERSFSCITHGEDEHGNVGVSLSKELMAVAGEALTKNMTAMAPHVLPWSELLKYAASYVSRTFLASQAKPYVPDFKRAFAHFCIHAGGKAVIQEMERSLRLPDSLTEASRMTLHRFGNTSSTSVWYEMAYLEAMRRVKRRHRLWQVALGSGFKCFSAVWEAQCDSRCTLHNPWRSCLLAYPLHVPDCCPELADDDQVQLPLDHSAHGSMPK